MNRLIAILLIAFSSTMFAQRKPTTPTADVMRELRIRALTNKPSDFGITPTDEYPVVYGALLDWPIGDNTATVVSFCTGDASLYTTSTFGVIGGIGHESVKKAAYEFVTEAGKFYDDSKPITEFPYPSADRIRFYLMTFKGVRVIDSSIEDATTPTGRYVSLFSKAQDVLTELRLVTEKN
jgi:hypothetical protein